MYSRLIYIYSLFKCINTFAATVQFSIRIKLMASMMCSRGWLYRYSATISITVIKWPKKLASTSTFLFFIRCSCSRSFHSFFSTFYCLRLAHTLVIDFVSRSAEKRQHTASVCEYSNSLKNKTFWHFLLLSVCLFRRELNRIFPVQSALDVCMYVS